MKPKQTRIFVPPKPPFDRDSWVENVVGHILQPVLKKHSLDWFWFSRYGADRSDSGDCDINKIPEDFAFEPSFIYRSLRFRFLSPGQQFEEVLTETIRSNECAISDIRDYSPVGDAASDRFLGNPRTEERRKMRADLIIGHFHATSLLFIDCLKSPDDDDYFSLESDGDSKQNPHQSIFESVHHIYCNQTDVPLRVLISQQSVGTDWYPPQNPSEAVNVRF